MKKQKGKTLKISQYLKLWKSQSELDFVDIDIYTDLPLFIDPWAIHQCWDDFSIECNNIIIQYFSSLIQKIKNWEKQGALDMLSQLKEPSETHLGLSRGSINGSWVWRDKAALIFQALENSKAVKTWFLQDIEDTALLITGISNDNISDMVTNVLRLQLIKYTQIQCNLYGIKMEELPTWYYWDIWTESWQTRYEDILVVNNKKLLLVPKLYVRKNLSVNFTNYYNKEVIEYEQMFHLNNNTSLCRTLSSWEIAKPYKKDLRKYHAKKSSTLKEYVYEFTKANPSVLQNFKNKLAQQNTILSNEIHDEEELLKSIDKLINDLTSLPPWKKHAYEYEKIIISILEIIFFPFLHSPQRQEKINNGLKIVDIAYYNAATEWFFLNITKSNIACRKIYFECKNYTWDIKNPEIDQLNGRFEDKNSEIWFIVCRKNTNPNDLQNRCKFFRKQWHYILILEDSDLITLLNYRKNAEYYNIDKLLDSKLNNLLYYL